MSWSSPDIGQPPPSRPPSGVVGYRRSGTRRIKQVGLAVAGLVLVGVAALLVLAAIGTELGGGGLVVGALFAVLPVIPVSLAFVWLDRWEPEPTRVLLSAFAWGATIAALFALLVNSVVTIVLTGMVGETDAASMTAIFSAPLVEEAGKGLFVLGFWRLHRREFDGVVDGIVLAGLVGVGFAFTENILYFGRAFAEGLSSSGVFAAVTASLATLIVRGVMSPFAHPLFTVMTGIGIGIAAATPRRAARWLAPIGGYLLAVVLHSLWNTAAVAGGEAFLTLYIAFMVPVFVGAIVLAIWSRRREGSIVQRQLPAYAAAGWLASHEVGYLSSLSARRQLAAAAKQHGGKQMLEATKDYHAAVTELAFLRERMIKGTAGIDATHRQDILLAALADRRRRAYVPHPRSTPVWRNA